MIFSSEVDIANRGLQHLGVPRIASFADNSKVAAEAGFVYDKLRKAELRANLWNFAARRLVLRAYIPGITQFIIPQAWSNVTTYTLGSLVNYNSAIWLNNIASNLNITPGTGLQFAGWIEFPIPGFVNPYVTGAAYYTGETVVYSSSVYSAIMNTSDPPTTAASWIKVSTAVAPLTLTTPFILSPAGVTTNTLTSPKPAYPLPSGYIRVMPQDGKTAATPAQLSTAGMQNSDFEFEGGFLLTNLTNGGPLVFRFTADLRNVFWLDTIFCEALACRIAIELCELVTQSPQKMNTLHTLYDEYIDKAQRVNAIEAGSTEPDTVDVKTNRRPSIEKAPPPQPSPRRA